MNYVKQKFIFYNLRKMIEAITGYSKINSHNNPDLISLFAIALIALALNM